MDKRKQHPVSFYILCLFACLCLLAGCNSQTSSLPATPPSLALTQTRISETQVTPDVLFNLVGTYTGTYQWHGSSSSAQLRLEITGQESMQLSGFCTLGDQRYPLKEALLGTAFGGEEAVMTFTLDVPGSQGHQPVSLNFDGRVTKDGAMSGNIIGSDGRTGIWSAKKV